MCSRPWRRVIVSACLAGSLSDTNRANVTAAQKPVPSKSISLQIVSRHPPLSRNYDVEVLPEAIKTASHHIGCPSRKPIATRAADGRRRLANNEIIK